MKQIVVLFIALFLSISANAEPPTDQTLTDLLNGSEAQRLGFRNIQEIKSYFDIRNVTVTETTKDLSPDELSLTGIAISNGTANSAVGLSSSTGIGDIVKALPLDFGDVKAWLTLGSKIWDVIVNNQPIVNVTTQTVSVLPQATPNWHQMETWKGPMAKSYTIEAKNFYGATVISHTYTVAYHYGGSLNGHGQFLANATILPTNVTVSWGFKLNSTVKVGDPLNTGSRIDPIPGLDLSLEWSMSSILKKQQGVDQFFVRGDGVTDHVNLY